METNSFRETCVRKKMHRGPFSESQPHDRKTGSRKKKRIRTNTFRETCLGSRAGEGFVFDTFRNCWVLIVDASRQFGGGAGGSSPEKKRIKNRRKTRRKKRKKKTERKTTDRYVWVISRCPVCFSGCFLCFFLLIVSPGFSPVFSYGFFSGFFQGPPAAWETMACHVPLSGYVSNYVGRGWRSGSVTFARLQQAPTGV